MTHSPWALERALAIVGLPTYALDRTAIALDAARLDGAERMREAAAAMCAGHEHDAPGSCVLCEAGDEIRYLDPARVLAGEE